MSNEAASPATVTRTIRTLVKFILKPFKGTVAGKTVNFDCNEQLLMLICFSKTGLFTCERLYWHSLTQSWLRQPKRDSSRRGFLIYCKTGEGGDGREMLFTILCLSLSFHSLWRRPTDIWHSCVTQLNSDNWTAAHNWNGMKRNVRYSQRMCSSFSLKAGILFAKMLKFSALGNA